MRTTVTLDPDVAAELERRRREHGRPFKQEVNDLLRLGLRQAEREGPDDDGREPFRTESASVGRVLAPDLDDVADALTTAEGDAHR